MTTTAKPTVLIESFGYLHGAAPEADITLDLRRHFRDPHVSPELRYMTADDEPVRLAVMTTAGIRSLVAATARAVAAFASGPSGDTVVVADGCAGGRHRAPTFARALADTLRQMGFPVNVSHRDMTQDVVER